VYSRIPNYSLCFSPANKWFLKIRRFISAGLGITGVNGDDGFAANSLMVREVASLLISRMTVPILYFMDKRWEHAQKKG
jgi:hypothetical protein